MLRIQLFGPFSPSYDGVPVAGAARRLTQHFWALLLLKDGSCERAAIASALWPLEPLPDGLRNVRMHLHFLRAILPPEASDGPWIDASHGAIEWRRSAACECDWWTFKRLLAGSDDLASTDPATAASHAFAALALVGDGLLPEWYADWLDPFRNEVVGAVGRLAERGIRFSVSSGDHGRAITLLAALRRIAPDDDAAIEDLARLVAHPGLTSVETRNHIGASAPALQFGEVHRRRGNLPAVANAFIGRRAEVAAVALGVARSALVTIVGPGGVGKTRLAVESARPLADDFADGTWMVDLSPYEDAPVIASAWCAALGLTESPDRPAIDRLTAWLGDRSCLLVVDNCEHVVDGARSVIEQLLAAAPSCRVIATSRVPLGLPAERILPLEPLPVMAPAAETAGNVRGEAVELFLNRAFGSGSALRTAEQQVDIEQICALVEGLPLAIELAAAQTQALDVSEVRALLSDWMLHVQDDSRSRPDRHRSLHVAINWTYSRLAAGHQRLLGYLAPFAGSFDLDAVRAMSSTLEGPTHNGEVDRTLGMLVDQSLVVAQPQSTTELRYRLLATVQAFAREQVLAAGTAEMGQRCYADYFTAWAVTECGHLESVAAKVHVEAVEREHDNLLGALSWSIEHDLGAAVQLCHALWPFWYRSGRVQFGLAMADRLLAKIPSAEQSRTAAIAFSTAGALTQASGRFALAADLFERARAFYETAGDDLQEAYVLERLCRTAGNLGRFGEARALGAAGLAIADRHGAVLAQARLASALAEIAVREQALDEAMRLFASSLHLAKGGGFATAEANAHLGVGMVQYRRGDFPAAKRALEEGLAIKQMQGDEGGIGACYEMLAVVTWKLGDAATARGWHMRSLAHYAELDHPAGQAVTMLNLGEMACDNGELDEAVDWYCRCVSIDGCRHYDRMTASARLAEIALSRDDALEARARLSDAAALQEDVIGADVHSHFRRIKARLALSAGDLAAACADLLEAAAQFGAAMDDDQLARWVDDGIAVAGEAGQPEAVATLLGAVEAWRAEARLERAVIERAVVQPAIDGARAALGSAAFEATYRRGRAMDRDAMVAAAIALLHVAERSPSSRQR